MKNITESINEARQISYRVSLNGCYDKEDLPVSVTILVDASDQKSFEDFLEKEQDDLFIHADGGNIEY